MKCLISYIVILVNLLSNIVTALLYLLPLRRYVTEVRQHDVKIVAANCKMPRHTSIASILPLSRCCMHYGHGRTLGSPCGPQHGLCTVCPCPVAQYNFIWVPGGHVGWDVLLVRRHLKYVSVWFTKFTKF